MSGMFPVASFPCICYRTEDYHCVSVSHLFGSPCLRESLYTSGLISVSPSQGLSPITTMGAQAYYISVKNGFYSSSKSKSIEFEVVLKVNEDSNRIKLESKNSDNSIQLLRSVTLTPILLT